ncbi:kinase-like domain-containing protein [Thelonectria olida]|uniref:non-specific serine/threonine protein kinase n=1 Tax=Thelonectria olida TaxID=1576542 RepID=A0A9P8VW06_9HYPO|nr:kinase-like domain-containing protein [Thelonectria olida]
MTSSSDEGEIVENGVEDLKATSLRHPEGSGVDRQDRNRSRLSTPDYDSASRYSNTSRRSPSPRGYKRPHDDRDRDRDYYSGRNRDYPSRPLRGQYDDPRRDDPRRSRAYDDLDRPVSHASDYNYETRDRDRSRDRDGYRDRDRDRYSNKRPRNRSRSPHRSNRAERGRFDRFVREGQYDRREDSNGLKYDDDRSSREGGFSSKRTPVGEASRTREHDAKRDKGTANGHDSRASQRVSFTQPGPKAKPAPQPEADEDFEEPEPIDEEAEIERRRKRREEILAKSSSATPLLLHAVGAASKARAESPMTSQADTPMKSQSEIGTPRTPRSDLASPRSPGSHDELSPGGINLLDDSALMNMHGKPKADDEDGPSAADYDPTVDMREDEKRDELRHGHVVLHGEHVTPDQKTQKEPQEPEPEKPAGDDDDNDEDFDMFAEDFDEDRYATKPTAPPAPAEANGASPDSQQVTQGGILEGDDKDGYYKIRIGEVLNGRYQIQSALGKGMFSGVARAIDITTKRPVAIKMMRNNDALRKGGYTEIAILQKLNEADPDNKKHIVKFERSFDYKGHLCMVFENLSLNLREVLRKFGNNVGINLTATRTYAYQIFVSLAHMRKCSIIHADLKPDNILVNDSRNVLKICDLGTAIDRSDAATAHTEITPYLVSRFYRAPEIMLGMPYDYAVDVWSIGCTLYELFTGKILFTGDSNNQMLKAIMEIRGKFTPKLFKRGQLAAVHFDDKGQFISVERDKVLNKVCLILLSFFLSLILHVLVLVLCSPFSSPLPMPPTSRARSFHRRGMQLFRLLFLPQNDKGGWVVGAVVGLGLCV